jgi:hypothetical protein
MGSLLGGGGGPVEGGRGSLPSLPCLGGGRGGGGLCTQSLITCLSYKGLQGTSMLCPHDQGR